MLREMKQQPTDLGRRLARTMEAGELVSDELMTELMRARLDRGDTRDGFVLDGYPRTLPQAEALEQMLRELGRGIDVVFEFQVPDRELLVERMLKRAAEEGRADDTPEAIDKRLALYEQETAPLVEHFRTRGNVVGIHGARPIDAVFAEIQETLDQIDGRSAA
jgi:adenylate kinase